MPLLQHLQLALQTRSVRGRSLDRQLLSRRCELASTERRGQFVGPDPLALSVPPQVGTIGVSLLQRRLRRMQTAHQL